MKTTSLLVALLLLTVRAQDFGDPSFVGALTTPVVVGGGGCDTDRDANASETTEGSRWYGFTGYLMVASKFTASASYTVCEADFQMRAASGKTPGWNHTVQIWSNNDQGNGLGTDDVPNAIVGSASSAVNLTGIGETYTTITVSWSSGSPSLTSGTTYWVIAVCPSNQAEYCQLEDSDASILEHICRSDSGSSWTSYSTERALKFTLRSE